MMMYIYKSSELPPRTGLIIANSEDEGHEKIAQVVSKFNLPFEFRVFGNPELVEKVNQSTDEMGKDILQMLVYGFRRELVDPEFRNRLNHFIFGTFPQDYETFSSLVKPPQGYLQRAIDWFKENEYYEINAKLKIYENSTRGPSVPDKY